MATATTYGTLSASEHSSNLRKAIIASTIGTTIEWYDFFLYGTAAGLIFGKLYFPNEDPLNATLAAFGTYFIGFVGRPIGAAIFGHYGDRIGRKATLIATLLLMGIATFLIAFLPTYAEIGIWGAVILTILRMIQGIGVGGEYGPQAALIAKAFTPRLRYSGSSLGYQLASVIAGGPAPLIATALFAHYHSGYAISVYILACAVVSLVSAAFMPDYTGQDISAEYDEDQPGSFRQHA